jgi:hypothetical protein
VYHTANRFLPAFLLSLVADDDAGGGRVLVAVEALIAIRDGLVDPHGVLNNWDQYSVDPCSWAMISCSAKNLVIGL